MKQSVKLPYPPAALSPNKKGHWGAKASAVKAYRKQCRLECMAQGIKGMVGPLKVTIAISYPDNRRRDWDNAIASFKAGQDAVAEHIGVDDHEWGAPAYVKGPNGGWVEVQLEEIE